MKQPSALKMIATDVVRALIQDGEVLRRIAISELQWLTINDLAEITQFSRKTIEKWRDHGWIRMFRVEDIGEWRTTLAMWREDQERLICADQYRIEVSHQGAQLLIIAGRLLLGYFGVHRCPFQGRLRSNKRSCTRKIGSTQCRCRGFTKRRPFRLK